MTEDTMTGLDEVITKLLKYRQLGLSSLSDDQIMDTAGRIYNTQQINRQGKNKLFRSNKSPLFKEPISSPAHDNQEVVENLRRAYE